VFCLVKHQRRFSEAFIMPPGEFQTLCIKASSARTSGAAPSSEPEWPPRSPRDALLTTPGGRERLRRIMNRTSTSPSPLKKTSVVSCNASEDQLDDEEDEETLQLKLQEIQARLKLKKLQSAKAKRANGEVEAARPTSEQEVRQPGREGTLGFSRPVSQNAVQIPASPVRRVQPPQLQTSPSRVLLGIDKGLKAKDMSLKRAPSLRKPQDNQDGQKQVGYLRRSKTPNPGGLTQDAPRPMNFNERLASARSDEVSRVERQERIKRIRTNAFDIGKEEMERYKSSAVELPDEPIRAPEFSRDEVLSTGNRPNTTGLKRSNTVPSVRTQPAPEPSADDLADSFDLPGWTDEARTGGVPPGEIPETEASSFEPYSTIHLSKRILPHQVLARHLSGKKTYDLKALLRVVKSPDYSLPEVEQDIVIFGIVAKKSDPRSHKSNSGNKQDDRGKYMVVTIVDLQFEVELFLFNSGFTRFWKITEGTVVAILNPNIMPPPPGRSDSGRFSLTINSDADTIIEVGMARDLGFCKSVKKDGNGCNSWVNKKRTEFCEFHTNEAVRRQRSSRVELNQMHIGAGPPKKKWNWKEHQERRMPKNNAYDRETHSHWFASKSLSAADLIDGVDNRDGGVADRKEKEEALKRRMAAKEKEMDMMKKLGDIGSGAGKDYMKHAARSSHLSSSGSSTLVASSTSNATDDPSAPIDAKSLGLLGSKCRDQAIRLSPVKRKRPESSASTSTVHSLPKSALGWGNNLKDKLARMKDGENLRPAGDRSPVRKKTRFVTEKGIREAGRESLGLELSAAKDRRQVTLDDDEDDDLLIV
jgi:minichromosome maintenance protein 10